MFPSRVNTIKVPLINGPTPVGGVAPSPATIVEIAKCDCVVRVRNNSFAVYVLLALDAAVLSSFPPRADTWKLPAGAIDVFVLKKGQALFVSTIAGPPDGSGAEVSFHVFESLPVDGVTLA